jgi:hypothetical protein
MRSISEISCLARSKSSGSHTFRRGTLLTKATSSEAPDNVRIVHNKTGELTLYDDDGTPLWPDIYLG